MEEEHFKLVVLARPLVKSMRTGYMIPELIREALAREKVWVNQSDDYCYLSLVGKGVEITVEWDTDPDPTARHALFAATVKYIKTKGEINNDDGSDLD